MLVENAIEQIINDVILNNILYSIDSFIKPYFILFLLIK
jgi:hypothetical protein